MKIKLTLEDVRGARSYVPLSEKLKFLETAYMGCLDKVELAIQEGGRNLPVPPLYKDNHAKKSRYMMGALVKLYLGKEYEPTGDAWLMAQDEYDRWAGSHILNQLERMKGQGGEIRDKVYDLLADYKDLEKRLNVEVYNIVQIQNDICVRIYAMISAQVTPEEMSKRMQELQKLKTELDKRAEKIKQSGK